MFRKYFVFLTLALSLFSCSIVSEKAAQKADKENAYLSTFLNKTSSTLETTFGKPSSTTTDENNQMVYVYEIKGKIFNCQRKFTIDKKNNISGFISTCWD